MEKNFCRKCGECCKHICVDFENKKLYFDGIQPLNDDFADMLVPIGKKENLTICYCKFLKNNTCSNNQKPVVCNTYPSSPFAYIPLNCGYSGEIFLKNEAEKQKIRKIKEDLIHYEALFKTTSDKHERQQYNKLIQTLYKKIQRFSEYGSEDW